MAGSIQNWAPLIQWANRDEETGSERPHCWGKLGSKTRTQRLARSQLCLMALLGIFGGHQHTHSEAPTIVPTTNRLNHSVGWSLWWKFGRSGCDGYHLVRPSAGYGISGHTVGLRFAPRGSMKHMNPEELSDKH